MSPNRLLRLAARPEGEVKASDFVLVDMKTPEPDENEFVVEITHISIDPAMRGWMSAARSYIPPVEVGEVMRAFTVGRVVESRNPDFAVGDFVRGIFGFKSPRSPTARTSTRSISLPVARLRPTSGFSD